MNWLAILPEIILTVTAAVVVLLDLWLEDRSSLLGYLAMAGALLALVSVRLVPVSGDTVLGNMLYLDGFTHYFRVILLLVTALVVLMSIGHVRRRRLMAGEFYGLILLGAVGMLIMAAASDLIMLYLGLELASVSTYVLVAMSRGEEQSIEAGLKYMLNGAVASAVLLFGLSLVYGFAGATSFKAVSAAVSGLSSGDPLAILITVLVLGGFGFKLALVPLHMWSPDAYQGAPTPVTAFLSAGSKVAAVAGFMRLLVGALGPLVSEWSLALAVLAALTMSVANLTALLQTDVKRMMAYSSIAQVGYLMTGLAVATTHSLTAMMFFLLAFAFADLAVFAAVVTLGDHAGSTSIDALRGAASGAPVLSAVMVIAFFSLIGLPLTGGFFGKLGLYTSAVEHGMLWLAILIGLNSAVSIGYYWRVVREMYAGTAVASQFTSSVQAAGVEVAAAAESNEGAASSPEQASWWASHRVEADLGVQVTVLVSIMIVILVGILPQPVMNWVQQAIPFLLMK